MYLLIIPRSNRFRSTSLREARLRLRLLHQFYQYKFRSTSLREARQDKSRNDIWTRRFRSTSLREARHQGTTGCTHKQLYLDPLASGRLDREKSHEIP